MKNTLLLTLIICLLFSFLSIKVNAQIESEKDSLEEILPFAKEYKRVDIYIALADIIKQNDTTNAKSYAQQAFSLSNRLSYIKGLAGAYVIFGYLDREKGQYKNAKINYLYAISYAIKSNDLSTIAWAYQNMGNLYYIQNDFTMAMRYYMSALTKGEKAGNQKRIALACNQIGSLYLDINDTLKAELYYTKSYKIVKDLNDEMNLAKISNNLGNIYKYKKEFIKALYYYSVALEIFKKNNERRNISTVLNNIGMIYYDQNKFDKSFTFLIESHNLDNINNDIPNKITSSLNLSSYYFKKNKLDSATYFAEISYRLAKQNSFNNVFSETCRQLSKIYETKGNSVKALLYLNESNDKNLLNATKGAEIEEVKASFEKAKKDETISILDNENKINKNTIEEKEIKVQEKNVLLLGLFSVIGFLILMGILFVYFLTQNKKRKTLELSSTAKSNILNRINKQLRTPLNTLINYSYLANESKNLTELREFLSGINASSNELVFSMNNIVSYLQIDAKNDDLINTPFNFIDSLNTIFNSFQTQCTQKNILFSKLISPEIPTNIICDKLKIETIIQNLLSNALKFSEKGVIKIEIKLLGETQIQNINKGSIYISVIDEGRGLGNKNNKNLLSVNKNNPENEGFGIGLFIVKKFIQQLNGTFELKNNETVGCTAEVIFDIQFDKNNLTQNNILLTQNSNKPINLLMVEDDFSSSYTLQKLLERKGFVVKSVFKGKDAFEILLTEDIDLVLVDLSLPDLNGLELCKLIRMGGEYALNKDIPIIALSANADPNEMRDCISIGVNEYLTKPIVKDRLLNKINELVNSKNILSGSEIS